MQRIPSLIISKLQRLHQKMSKSGAIVEGNVQVHDEALGFVPLKVTGVPEDEQVFFENGDFEGLLKHMQEKGEIGTAKPSKKAKKSKKSK